MPVYSEHFKIIKIFYKYNTVQRLILSKSTKRKIFYHIKVILQFYWDKTIARSGTIYIGMIKVY